MVIRPKSSATVVVVLFGMPARLSTPALDSVISSSVRSGGISLTAPTMVVLPTPNPPATRILTATASRIGSEVADAIQHLPHHVQIGRGRLPTRAEDHEVQLDQVADQHLGHAERQVQFGRHLRDRRREGTHPQYLGV